MTKRLVLTVFAILGIAGTAAAAPLVLPSNEPVYFQFNNLEDVNLANTLVVPGYAPAAGLQGNWGVFNISSIQHGAALAFPPHNDIAGGSAFFSDTGGGAGSQGQITGIFYGIQNCTNVALCGGVIDPTTSTGGHLDIFWHDPGTSSIDAACLAGGCAPDATTVAKFTSGTFLGRLDFANGINANPNVFTKSNVDPSTPGGSGHADSFAEVNNGAGGPWASQLDGNWFLNAFITPAGASRDLRFSTFFNADVSSWTAVGVDGGTCPVALCGAGTVGLRSNDPARVFTAATVPEPATLTLLGLGLAALGARRRKKA